MSTLLTWEILQWSNAVTVPSINITTDGICWFWTYSDDLGYKSKLQN